MPQTFAATLGADANAFLLYICYCYCYILPPVWTLIKLCFSMKLLAAIHQENWGQKRTMALAGGGREVESQGWAVVLTVPDLGGEDHFIWM